MLYVGRSGDECEYVELDADPGDLAKWRAGWDAQRDGERRRRDLFEARRKVPSCIEGSRDFGPGVLKKADLIVYGKGVRFDDESFTIEAERAYVTRGRARGAIDLGGNATIRFMRGPARMSPFVGRRMIAALERNDVGHVVDICEGLRVMHETETSPPDSLGEYTSAPLSALACGMVMTDVESASISDVVFHARVDQIIELGNSSVRQLELSDIEVYRDSDRKPISKQVTVAWTDGTLPGDDGLLQPGREVLFFGKVTDSGVILLNKCGGSRNVGRPTALDLGGRVVEEPSRPPKEAARATSCAAASPRAPRSPFTLVLVFVAGSISLARRRRASRRTRSRI